MGYKPIRFSPFNGTKYLPAHEMLTQNLGITSQDFQATISSLLRPRAADVVSYNNTAEVSRFHNSSKVEKISASNVLAVIKGFHDTQAQSHRQSVQVIPAGLNNPETLSSTQR